jgi:predicted permease
MGMVLSESMVVATLAGLTALLFVVWGRALLERLLPAELPGLGAGGPGLEALLLVLALVIVTGFAVGIIPAMQAVHVSGGDTAGAAGRVMERRRRLHPGLVVAQIALAVVLVVSAGLLARSVLGLRAIPLGFDTDRIVTFEARLPWAESWDTTEFRNFAHDVRDRLVAQPGILEVGMGSRLPLSESMGVGYRVWGEGDAEETSRAASLYNVSSSYFSALGIAFLAGDTFEDATSAQSAIISRTVAQQLFGGVDVVGRGMRVRTSFRTEPRLYTVVGVVGDVRANGFTSEPGTALYLPFDRQAVPSMAFALRADRHLRDIVPLIRSVVSDVNPEVAPFALRTMSGAASERIAANQALALVSTLFGATALLLAILGIYGLVAQSVTRRRKEMGLGLAVGARSADLARLVLAQALALASLGVGIGILASLGATRFLASFLFGVGAADPLTFAGVALMALVAVLAASLLPARRAARVDPLESLRTG